MGITREELDAELESLQRQMGEKVKARDEAVAAMQQIAGAVRVTRHLIDRLAVKAIKAREEADAAPEAA